MYKMTSQKNPVFLQLMNQAIRTAVLNPQGSKTFLKKMLSVSVEFILHQRTDLDRSNFETKTHNNVPYKVFKGRLHDPLLKRVKKWIKGALHALDKNYLREVYLILCSEDDPTKIYESYKIQFRYLGNDAISLGRSATQKELTDSTDTLLKAINSLDQFAQLKTDKVTVKMALTYYEDVTPADYEPPCYNKTDNGADAIMQNVSSHSKCYFQLGKLNTGFDIVKCRAKGDVFSMDQSLSSSASNLHEDDLTDLDDLEKSTEDLRVVNNETQMATAGSATPNEHIEDDLICISDDEDEDSNISKNIQCGCQLIAEFSHVELIKCSRCSYLQHSLCMGYLYAKMATDKYICRFCKLDKSLTAAVMRSERQTAVYRLIIGYAYFSNEFPEEVLAKLSSESQTAIKQKLKSVHIISENDGKFSVDIPLIDERFLKHWFQPSFAQRNKLLPDSINLMESSPQEDEDSLILEEPSQKKVKH